MRLVLLDTAKIEVYKGKGFIGDRGGSEAESAGRRYEIPVWTFELNAPEVVKVIASSGLPYFHFRWEECLIVTDYALGGRVR